MFSDKNKIDETSGLSFIVICDNKIILFSSSTTKLVAKLMILKIYFHYIISNFIYEKYN